jgi:hypothetical protein
MLPLSRQARIAAAVLPPGMRFRFALAVSRLHGRVMGALGSNRALTEAVMRDHWLRELTLHGGFPIPWRLHGRDILDHYEGLGPVLYYTMHVPLCEIPLRVFIDAGYRAPIPMADPGRIVEQEKIVVPGLQARTPSFPITDSPLVRMRTLLQRGQSVACLADRYFAGDFYVNPMRLAARLGVPVIFSSAELGPDGVVDVTFRPLPHPLCETVDAITQNLRFLEETRDRILRSLGVWPAQENVAEMPQAAPASLLREPQDAPSA